MRPAPNAPKTLKLALKIDVDTYRGTREGVPRLVEMLERHGAGATFFFSVGPDREGLLYGTVVPAPDIGRRCAEAMRAARDAGFESGLQAWDHARWRRGAAGADADWTARQMALAMARFEAIFGERAAAHAAAGWQTNRHALRNTQALAFDYASDTRGTHPFVPIVRAEIVACPQFPTTLPTLAEAQSAPAALLEKSTPSGAAYPHHVYTARASLEGGRLAGAFEQLLEGWIAQGYELVAIRELVREAAGDTLPMHSVVEGPVALQGPEFLAENAASGT